MNRIIVICLVLITTLFNAQKLKIRDFKIVDYEITDAGIVEISTHSIIDRQGNLIVYSESWDGKNYFKYKLSNEEIEKLNSLAGKRLDDFIKQKKLNENQFFAGERKYISFKYKGSKNKLCLI